MKTVLKYLKPYMFSVIFCLAIKTVSAFFELAIPRMLAIIIDEDVPRGDMSAVLKNGGIMLLLAILTFVFNVFGNRLSGKTTGKIARDLRHDLFVSTVHLDVAKTDDIGLSSLTARLTSDSYNVTNFLARIQRIGIKAPMMLLGGIIVTMTIDYKLSLILLIILPLVAFTVYIITKKSIPIYNEEQQILDSLVRRVDETASGIRVIKALSKIDYEKSRFERTSEELCNKELYSGKITSLTKPVNDFVFYMGLCLVIFIASFTSKDSSTAGKLLAFMTYFTIILNNMIMMSRVFVQTSRAFASAGRIEEVLLSETALGNAEGVITEIEDFISFNNVSFSYNKKQKNIDNISFSVKKNQTLGIIGATGSGKSTLINLLLRLYDVDEGEINIKGRNIKNIPKEKLYGMFGVAFQNDFIPRESIYENVSFFRNKSSEEVNSAIKIAKADFVYDDEEGLLRQVATGGTNLSGGQKQRLTIARAIAGEPEIIILDDAFSALDYKTDFALRKEIKSSLKTTTIIVSQRIASVMSADKILVIDEGRLIGEGTHEALLKDCMIYREIAEVQGIR